MQLKSSDGGVLVQFVDECELIAAPRAVEQRNPGCRGSSQQVIEHGPQGRNSCPASDTQDAVIRGHRWQREVADRSFEIDQCTRAGGREVCARITAGIDGDQQLEALRFSSSFGRTGDGIRSSIVLPVGANNNGLAW